MAPDEFELSLKQDAPPAGLGPLSEALWWVSNNHWDRAHGLAQGIEHGHGAWLHAYLHRVEGDDENAEYWYARASKAPANISLAEERQRLVEAVLLEESGIKDGAN